MPDVESVSEARVDLALAEESAYRRACDNSRRHESERTFGHPGAHIGRCSPDERERMRRALAGSNYPADLAELAGNLSDEAYARHAAEAEVERLRKALTRAHEAIHTAKAAMPTGASLDLLEAADDDAARVLNAP